MLILCLQSLADSHVKEQLWLSADWVSYVPGSATRFYIREDRLAWAKLIDPHIQHIARHDHIL